MDQRQPDLADGAAVVVVGSVNVDLVVSVPRLPAPGETVIGGRFQRAPGGKGGNQAVAAARLGARTWLVGCVGDDDLGRDAREDLREAGVDTGLVGVGRAPTGVAAVLVDRVGENAIAVASGANDELDPETVRSACASIPSPDAVVLASLEVPDAAVLAAAQAAAARGWPFVLNPAPARPLAAELLRRCAVLTPNQQEATALGVSSVQDLLAGGVGAVVVTRGAQGADLHRQHQPVWHQPPFAVRALDTTGAGDAFSAALAWALARGRSLEEAVQVAAAVGALSTQAVGARASLPDQAALDRFLATGQPARQGGDKRSRP
jgi:ribokinase